MLALGIGFFVIVIGAVLVVFSYGITVYNGLVKLKNQTQRAFANIDVILKQRHDEIPQLLQVIEQYAQYERGTIDRVIEARTRYGQASTVNEKVQASQEMSLALRGVFAIGEAYPELKANQQFTQLQTRVSALESELSDRRESYNESVTNYNTRIQQIPDVFFARMLGYQPFDLFRVTEDEKVAPNLKMQLPA
jgi:LemA protein